METMIAACGLDCGKCEIRRAPFDKDAEKELVAWFRQRKWIGQEEGIEEILSRKMYCCGCHGEKELHWSPDCWILACCEKRSIVDCSYCAIFPCEALATWSKQDESYTLAFKALEQMREQRNRASQPSAKHCPNSTDAS